MKDKIIELNNNTNYYVLDELVESGRKYIFASQYNEIEETINENSFVILEVTYENDNLKLLDIEKEEEAERITKLFLEKIKNQKETI